MQSQSLEQGTPRPQLKSRSYFESPIQLIQNPKCKVEAQQPNPIQGITELQGQDGLDIGHLSLEIQTDNPDILLFDVYGNQIAPALSEFQVQGEKEESEGEREDLPKENDVPKKGLATPLKVMRPYPNRSPLLDITPSLTQRKPKKGSHTDQKNKALFMTPKTMAESRKFDFSHLKNSRM